MTITLDTKRLEIVFGTIFKAYGEQTHLFAFPENRAEQHAPQLINRPKHVSVGDERHLYWLALTAMSDSMTHSGLLYKNSARMFSRNPSLYEVGRIPTLRRTRELFKRYGIALPHKQAVFFRERKRHLDLLFAGNPLNIYRDVSTIEQLLPQLRALGRSTGVSNVFPGAKGKILTLLAMYLSEAAGLQFKDLVAADLWVQRLANTTDALVGDGVIMNERLERMLRPEISRIYHQSVPVSGLANATWLLGNRLCSKCHKEDVRALCPIYDLCNGPSRSMRDKNNRQTGKVQRPYTKLKKCTY